jgi:lycopene beta-cyclase
MDNTYDYIIAGSGAAGLSLLYALLCEKELRHKDILIIDKDEKKQNDRTWCFWEKTPGPFEEIVHHQWKNLIFHNEDFSKELPLEEYTYKMIRGIDFYNHVLELARQFKNVTFHHEEIKSIESEEHFGIVKTNNSEYKAPFVFNSTSLFQPEINTKNSLLQHFMGWVIETPTESFDPRVGTLMDFRVHQNHGDTFMYVLPTDKRTALIEYTLFTEKLLDKDEYKKEIENYIDKYLNLTNYTIAETEFGVIPMSLAKFERHSKDNPHVYNIGTAGGFTKASSGYTFQFIQKHTKEIIASLKKNKVIFQTPTLSEKIFQWYDSVLLDVILEKKTTGKKIFSIMFKNMKADHILKFLGNESKLWDDVKIMIRLPIHHFLVSGIKQLNLFKKRK